jgi:hypothetical protein
MTAPTNVIEHFVREAAIEFARKTSILQRTLWVDLQECVRDYRLVAPDGYKIHLISEVSMGCLRLHPAAYTTRHDLRHAQYFFDPPCGLAIGNSPDADEKEGLAVRTSVIPSHESCEVDAILLDLYADDIRAGALSRLFLMNNQPWYSTMNGGIWLKRWKSAINQVKVEKVKNHSTGALKLTAPRFI